MNDEPIPPSRGRGLPEVYPGAERLDLVDHLPAGDPDPIAVPDPYRWLEDPDDARTAAWSAGQDALYRAHAATWPGIEQVTARVRELLSAGVVGVPVHRGHRVFFMRRTGEQEHAVLHVREDNAERVLIDPMRLDPSGTTTLDSWQPSKEGNLLAYQVSEGGSEESVLRVLDVATGAVVDGPIDRARYSPVAWLRGERAFYYVRRLPPQTLPEDERQYHRRVWLHRLGTDPDDDVEIFGSGRPIIDYYGASVSWNGRWLTVSAASGTDPRNDVWVADLTADDPASPRLRPVVVGLDARTGVHLGPDDRMYIHTDLEAPRGRLAVADPAKPGPESWQPLVPERPDAVLEDFALIWPVDGTDQQTTEQTLPQDRRLLVSWTEHAVSTVTTHRLDGTRTGDLLLPGLGSVGGLVTKPDGGPDVWFSYTDHVTVPTVYRHRVDTGETSVYAAPPGAVATPPDVLARQVSFQSPDGTTVRMFVLANRRYLARNGDPTETRPAVLYGYGGFGASLTPGYSAGMLAWVEAGGVYAVANLRGGGEEGESWHRDGMLANKQRVFEDFHAAAQTLIHQGWTTSDRLAISGGSNGGLLVGAALTQRPGLFRAVVCSAPLLDMVRYQLHGLGATWAGEYGDATVRDELRWLFGYSPYHHVAQGVSYPAVLFTVFDSDSRVDPLHARKLAAALQAATTGDPHERPILVRAESEVGHGARAISRSLELTAQTLCFMAHHTGLSWGP